MFKFKACALGLPEDGRLTKLTRLTRGQDAVRYVTFLQHHEHIDRLKSEIRVQDVIYR